LSEPKAERAVTVEVLVELAGLVKALKQRARRKWAEAPGKELT
jgi:hypothetical protein